MLFFVTCITFVTIKKQSFVKIHIIFLILSIASACFSQQEKPNDLSKVSTGKLDHYDAFPSVNVHPRNVDVWLPESYNSTSRYSVIYFHDGQMLFDSTSTWNGQEWGLDETAGRLISNNLVRPFIIVAIWNTKLRHSEYFPQKAFMQLSSSFRDSLLTHSRRNSETALFQSDVQSDAYLRFIVTELKPFIDKQYATLPDRENTFIAGSSMGGLISMYAVCEYPDVFGGAACLSTHWPGIFTLENNPVPDAFLNYLRINIPDADNHRWYFDHGTETLDQLYGETQVKVDELFYKMGYSDKNFVSLRFEGADHTEKAWCNRVEIPLQFLLPPFHKKQP